MADTTTTNLSLTKPEVGSSADSWGDKINANFDALDTAIDSKAPKANPSFTGNVGIGCSPAEVLDLKASSGDTRIRLDAASGSDTEIKFFNAGIVQYTIGHDDATDNFVIGGANVDTPMLSVDKSGNVLVGTEFTPNGTSAYGAGFINTGASGLVQWISGTSTASAVSVARFYNPNGNVGSIQLLGEATSYNTSSDYRLKEDWQPIANATETFMQLKPCNFAWKVDGTRVDGFLAHELQEVIPCAATGEKDAMKDEEYEVSPAMGDVYTAGSEAGFNEVSPEVVGGPAYYDIDGVQIRSEIISESAVHEAFDAAAEVINSSDVAQPETLEEGQAWRETTAQVMATRSVPDMQGIDQAKVVPLLTAALQEAINKIEAMELRITALEP